jgi:hypothetical protein
VWRSSDDQESLTGLAREDRLWEVTPADEVPAAEGASHRRVLAYRSSDRLAALEAGEPGWVMAPGAILGETEAHREEQP